MARLKDLPNELYLELMYQCHPRDLLALIMASSSVFRVFQWHRNPVINQLVLDLSAVPWPIEACAIARLRHLEKKCKPTAEYRCRVGLEFPALTDISTSFIKVWPSNLSMLAMLADICDEDDLLVEKVRAEHWDTMVSQAREPRWTLGCHTEPVPSQLGIEEHYLIRGVFWIRAILSAFLSREPNAPYRDAV